MLMIWTDNRIMIGLMATAHAQVLGADRRQHRLRHKWKHTLQDTVTYVLLRSHQAHFGPWHLCRYMLQTVSIYTDPLSQNLCKNMS